MVTLITQCLPYDYSVEGRNKYNHTYYYTEDFTTVSPVGRLDLAGFETNHMHRHSFIVILECSNMEPRIWITYVLEITLTASNLEPTLAAVLKCKRIR